MTLVVKRSGPWAASMLVHGGFVAVLILVARIAPDRPLLPEMREDDRIPLYFRKPVLLDTQPGGGGSASPLRAAQGMIPKIRRLAVIPPMQVVHPDPELVLDAGIELTNPSAVPDVKLPV